MKNIIAIFCVLSSLTLFSQTNKGHFLIGGDFEVSSNKRDSKQNNSTLGSTETGNLLINPKLGYYVSENTILGIGFGAEQFTFKEKERPTGNQNYLPFLLTTENKGKFLFINPNISFQKNLAKNFKFDLNTELRLVSGEIKYKSNGEDAVTSKYKAFEFNFRPGFFYYLTSRTILVGHYGNFSYFNSKEVIESEVRQENDIIFTRKNLGLNLGFDSFRLGFLFKLSRKEKQTN